MPKSKYKVDKKRLAVIEKRSNALGLYYALAPISNVAFHIQSISGDHWSFHGLGDNPEHLDIAEIILEGLESRNE